MSDSPSPPTRQSATTAADSLRVPRAPIRTRPRQRGTSLSTTRRPDFSFRRDESKHPHPSRRKSCCQRWFRWGSKKRNKKCKKKCKTRRKKRTRKKKRKKRKKRTRRK